MNTTKIRCDSALALRRRRRSKFEDSWLQESFFNFKGSKNMLPRLSLITDCDDWIYFFIQIKRKILYAIAEKDGEFWWVEEIK
jgi:hypothetical protein